MARRLRNCLAPEGSSSSSVHSEAELRGFSCCSAAHRSLPPHRRRICSVWPCGPYSVVGISMPELQACIIFSPKATDHILFWRDILSVFPEAHFIHIIRDPRAVVASMLAVAHSWGPRWAPGEIFAATDRWTAFVAVGRQIKSATPRYYEIAYEELVASGSHHLERLFKWLCIDVSPGECERYLQDCHIDRLQEGELDGMEIAIGQRRREFFRFGQIDHWKRELSSWEVAAIERRAQPLLRELGFACSNRHSTTTSVRVALYALKMTIQAGIKVQLEAVTKHL